MLLAPRPRFSDRRAAHKGYGIEIWESRYPFLGLAASFKGDQNVLDSGVAGAETWRELEGMDEPAFAAAICSELPDRSDRMCKAV
jgi:hypothetical protein